MTGSKIEQEKQLIDNIWKIKLERRYQQWPYLRHFYQLRDDFAHRGLHAWTESQIVELVKLVRDNQTDDLATIEQKITARGFPVGTAIDLLKFVLQLWLFVEPDLKDKTVAVDAAIKLGLPQKNMTIAQPATSEMKFLPRSFCEKNLTRKSGMRIEPTDQLCYHLRLIDGYRIQVFCHTSALSPTSGNTTLPFPADFVEETLRTIELLYYPSKYRRRMHRKAHWGRMDLESAIRGRVEEDDWYDLSKYVYYAPRLREIAESYNRSQPSSIKQWWFDRRDRFQWAAFWTALFVFVFTWIFGLSSMVTGIMQVGLSQKALIAARNPVPPSRA